MFSHLDLADEYYPVVGSVSIGAKLKVVFDSKEFVYDLKDLENHKNEK
jgi:hypothetical protein